MRFRSQGELRHQQQLTAGLRFFHFAINNLANQAGLGTAAANQDHTILSQSASGNAVLPKLNLAYEPTSDLTVYGTIAKGSRPGGFNLPIPLPTASVLAINPYAYNCGVGAVNVSSQPNYTPDSVWSAEIGEKARFADRRITVNADFYYIKWDNIQVQETTADGAFVYQGNAGTAHVQGVEFEFTAHPIEYFTVSFAGSYQEAYLTQGATPAQNSLNPTLGRTGDAIPNVPKFQLNLGLNYTAPLTESWQGVVATDVTYRDAENAYFTSNVQYNIDLAPYALLNLRLGAIHGPWTVNAFARNLTDKRAQVSAINSSQDPDALLTVRPRTVGVNLTRKF